MLGLKSPEATKVLYRNLQGVSETVCVSSSTVPMKDLFTPAVP
jgi:hypothetical protein